MIYVLSVASHVSGRNAQRRVSWELTTIESLSWLVYRQITLLICSQNIYCSLDAAVCRPVMTSYDMTTLLNDCCWCHVMYECWRRLAVYFDNICDILSHIMWLFCIIMCDAALLSRCRSVCTRESLYIRVGNWTSIENIYRKLIVTRAQLLLRWPWNVAQVECSLSSGGASL